MRRVTGGDIDLAPIPEWKVAQGKEIVGGGGWTEDMKPSPEELAPPPESFVGMYVMLPLPIEGSGQHERMWVKVTGLAEGEDEELRGRLVNDPVYLSRFNAGDVFEFKRAEVVRLIPKYKPKKP